MKKFNLLLLTLICLCSLTAYAGCGSCSKEQVQPRTSCETPCETKCPQTCITPCSERFLCTKTNLDSLKSCMNLSEAQLCNAHKIQEKYDQEVYSMNERIKCEKQKLCQMERNCAKGSEIRKQKRLIRRLEKEIKKICDCYEKQFKATLSDQQIRAYNKSKK